jgi:hypothetical protein
MFETGLPHHVNISMVGSMWRERGRTVLAFVGGDAQKVEVNETPEPILRMHLGPAAPPNELQRATQEREGSR